LIVEKVLQEIRIWAWDDVRYGVAKKSANTNRSHYKNNQSFPGQKARRDGWWVAKRSGDRRLITFDDYAL